MEKFRIIIAVILIASFGVIVWINTDRNEHATEQQAQTDSERFKREYPETPDENRFVYASSEQVIEILEDGSGLIFLGFPECPWCQVITPILDKAAQAEGLDEIHYFNIREARANNDPIYQQLIEELEEYLRTDEDGAPRIYVPDISAVRNGEIVGHFLQETAAGSEQATPETYWTNERSEQAIDQLEEMIRKVQDE